MTAALGIILRGGLDPDAARLISVGGIANSTEKKAVNTLARSLKAAALWNKFYALYPFAGGTAAAHAQNLISASYTITWVNGPTHNANGITGNGTTQYGTCVGLNGTVVAHLGGCSVYARTNVTPASGIATLIGMQDAAAARPRAIDRAIFAADTYNRGFWGLSANVVFEGPGVAARIGLISLNRTATNAIAIYANGVSFASNTTNDTSTVDAIDFNILSLNQDGLATAFNASNLALATVHQGLTAAQVVTFTEIVEAYQDTLERGVV